MEKYLYTIMKVHYKLELMTESNNHQITK